MYFSSLWICLFWKFHANKVIWHMAFFNGFSRKAHLPSCTASWGAGGGGELLPSVCPQLLPEPASFPPGLGLLLSGYQRTNPFLFWLFFLVTRVLPVLPSASPKGLDPRGGIWMGGWTLRPPGEACSLPVYLFSSL